jgi:hypothetical protein
MDAMKSTVAVAHQLEAQSLNSIVAGFSFASAIAYMDLVRWVIAQVIRVPKNSGYHYLMTALLTTLLSIVVYMLIKRFVKPDIKAPSAPVYAVAA